MPNDRELCACSQELLASRSVEDNLANCTNCGIARSCYYPRSVIDRMMKQDAETNQPNLMETARQSHDFVDFCNRMDRLERQPQTSNYHTKKKTLKELACESATFSEYHAKVVEQNGE